MEAPTGVWKEVDDFVKERHIPIHMMLEVTRKCNISCVHCYNVKDKAHLPLEKIDEIFRQLREAGCLFLTLTGGEIFARPDAADILYLARDYGFDIRIITNGTMITKQNAKVLSDVAPTEVGVSVLGACAETHDKIARVPGAFDRTIRGVLNCKEAGVPVHIKCTLMQENVSEYKDVMKLAKKLGVVYMIDPIVTPRDDGDTKNLSHRLDTKEMEDFYIEHFKDVEDDGPLEKKEKGLPCEAGTSFGSISADGNIYPCIQLPKKVGNVFENNLSEVWNNNETLHEIRNRKRENFGNCSDCSGFCNHCAGLAYLETGDMFGPSSIGCFIGGIFKKIQAMKEGKNIKDMPKVPCGPSCSCQQ